MLKTLVKKLVLFGVIGGAAVACSAEADESPQVADPETDSIARFATELSIAVEDADVLAALLAQLGDHEDGLAPAAIAVADGRSLADRLGVDAELGARLRVRTFGAGDGGAAPLVTWLPEAAEPASLTYLRAGAVETVLDAEATPEEPVLVVDVVTADVAEADRAVSALAAGPMKQVRLKRIRILHDSEVGPWNDPELYLRCAFPSGDNVHVYLPNVDQEKKWYDRDKFIVNWYESYGNPMRCAFFEEDGGSWGTLTVTGAATLGGVDITATYEFPFRDKDDFMGQTIVNWFDPNCTTYSTGDVDFKLCW